MKYIFLAIVIVAMTSCSSKNGQQSPNENLQDTTKIVTEQEDTLLLPEEQDSLSGESLNDIRFHDFTDKDWVDNEYIRTYRNHLDDYLEGKIEDSSLDQYREKISGKFVLADVAPFLLGGLYIQVIFLDNPENIFSVWIYSEVDEHRKITNYSVHRTDLEDENSGFTKEDILEFLKENPNQKLW